MGEVPAPARKVTRRPASSATSRRAASTGRSQSSRSGSPSLQGSEPQRKPATGIASGRPVRARETAASQSIWNSRLCSRRCRSRSAGCAAPMRACTAATKARSVRSVPSGVSQSSGRPVSAAAGPPWPVPNTTTRSGSSRDAKARGPPPDSPGLRDRGRGAARSDRAAAARSARRGGRAARRGSPHGLGFGGIAVRAGVRRAARARDEEPVHARAQRRLEERQWRSRPSSSCSTGLPTRDRTRRPSPRRHGAHRRARSGCGCRRGGRGSARGHPARRRAPRSSRAGRRAGDRGGRRVRRPAVRGRAPRGGPGTGRWASTCDGRIAGIGDAAVAVG